MLDDIVQCLCAAVVEVRCMLPQRAQRRRPVRLLCRAQRIRRIHPGFRRRMEDAVVGRSFPDGVVRAAVRIYGSAIVVVGESGTYVAGYASLLEDELAASRPTSII